jgi:hypothetical protein
MKWSEMMSNDSEQSYDDELIAELDEDLHELERRVSYLENVVGESLDEERFRNKVGRLLDEDPDDIMVEQPVNEKFSVQRTITPERLNHIAEDLRDMTRWSWTVSDHEDAGKTEITIKRG